MLAVMPYQGRRFEGSINNKFLKRKTYTYYYISKDYFSSLYFQNPNNDGPVSYKRM